MEKEKKQEEVKKRKKQHPVPSRSERKKRKAYLQNNKQRKQSYKNKAMTIEEIKRSNRRNKFLELRFFVLLLFFFMVIVFVLAVVTGSGSQSPNKEKSSDKDEVDDTPVHEEVVQKENIEKFTFGKIEKEYELYDPLNMTNSFDLTPAAFGEKYNRAAISKNLPLIVGFERHHLHYHFTLERKPENLKEKKAEDKNQQTANDFENEEEIIREPTYRMSFKEYLATKNEPAYFVFNVDEVDMLESDEEFFSIAFVLLDTLTRQEYTQKITEDFREMQGAELSRNGIWSETRNYGGVNAEFYKNAEVWFMNLSRPTIKEKPVE